MICVSNKRNARSQARARNWSGWRRASERSSQPNMLSQAQRTAILELNAKGVSKREIARVLQLSRLTVRKVLRSNSTQVPEIQRAQKAEPYRQQILDLWIRPVASFSRTAFTPAAWDDADCSLHRPSTNTCTRLRRG